ncbi:TlpA family protein disulfide reductase [Sphingobacterium bambusae]|uniref:TlpA family protein disulfide reductase n=1 Tax=Sphingobacterium bambusae TaxID=662858 RepID=A0ABW6BIJ9_9SPHI|nr:hypothetical protein [Sphingobacterium bambusae]WPL51022.1 hypothetical protein SCB77_11230 [Sphingobacterium bambusae]
MRKLRTGECYALLASSENPLYNDIQITNNRTSGILCCILIGLTFLLFTALASAQSTGSKKRGNGQLAGLQLKIGDTVPEQFYSETLQIIDSTGATTSAAIAEWRNKRLVIIDFFGSTCGPCIAWLKKMDSLEIDSRAVIIPVTSESAEKTQHFLFRHSLKTFGVYGDSTIRGYFPHIFLPHQVWILDGKVAAISNGSKTDPQSIKAALDDGKLNFQTKTDINVDLAKHLASNPLIKFDDKLISSFNITSRIEGLNGRGYFQQEGKSIFYYFNGTINGIVQELAGIPFNQISIAKDASTRLLSPSSSDRYCLQAIRQGKLARDSLGKLLLPEFATQMDLIISHEQRNVPVFTITGASEVTNTQESDRIPIRLLMDELNYYASWAPGRPIYVCDNPELWIDGSLLDRPKIRQLRSDPGKLSKELEKMGLKVNSDTRTVRFLEISERGAS